MRPYKLNIGTPLQEHDIVDLQLTVEGLSKLFTKFLYNHPTTATDTILNMLVTHLRLHYEQPMILEQMHLVRLVVRFKNNDSMWYTSGV